VTPGCQVRDSQNFALFQIFGRLENFSFKSTCDELYVKTRAFVWQIQRCILFFKILIKIREGKLKKAKLVFWLPQKWVFLVVFIFENSRVKKKTYVFEFLTKFDIEKKKKFFLKSGQQWFLRLSKSTFSNKKFSIFLEKLFFFWNKPMTLIIH
jgi:hypothetical protein